MPATSTNSTSHSPSHHLSHNDPRQFPLEDIVQHPLPGYVAPAAISFSPDDTVISYLFSPEGSLSRKLYGFDASTKSQFLLVTPPGGGVDEGNLSVAEKLRRERLRERGLGVTRYDWSTAGNTGRLLVPLPDGIYVQDGRGSRLRLLVRSSPQSPIIDPQISPDGSAVAYVQEDELWVVSTTEGVPQRLTSGARSSNKTHGLAEYIAQEEMERRTGFWWSHNSRQLAFAEVDTSDIPLFRITHQGKPSTGPDSQEDHPYPFAGKANAKVRLGVLTLSPTPDVTWMDLLCGGDRVDEEYLARVHWTPAGSLLAQVENRKQTHLKLLRFDPSTGARETLLEEHSPVWVNLHNCFAVLGSLQQGEAGRPGGGFIWASERTGFRHLYLHDAQGALIRAITTGEWMVEQLVGVDEGVGHVYYTGTRDGPLESHLYRSPLDASLEWTVKLTGERGRHSVVLDHRLETFVDVFDSLDAPPSVTLRSLADGRKLAVIYEPDLPNLRARRLQLAAPEIVTVDGGDGTTLYGALYRPDASVFGHPPYRTVVSVYGGPHVQTVCNSWLATVDMRAQYLRSKGILVWKLDNRGSARRGLGFEGAIKGRMGEVDVEDQATGVRWLLSKGLAHPSRIGIYGWSYGGYLAAMCLAKSPDLFRCAVSGAPVTSWDGYDTHYTERYMGLPGENEGGYRASSVMEHVGGIHGSILLVHGMIDENVHFRHTARLVNALTSARKAYELLVFPDERHMPRGIRDRIYMEERIFGFLDRNLK